MKPINAAPHGLLQTLQREQLATPLLCVPWSRQPHLTMCDLQSAAAHVVQPLWAAFWLQTPTSVTVCVCQFEESSTGASQAQGFPLETKECFYRPFPSINNLCLCLDLGLCLCESVCNCVCVVLNSGLMK